jgi:hypothetical protein
MKSEMNQGIEPVMKEMHALGEWIRSDESQSASIATLGRKTMAILDCQTKFYAWMKQRLTKLDELDGIQEKLRTIRAEIKASRQERLHWSKIYRAHAKLSGKPS